MKKRYLECGKIVSIHGVRGELKVQPWSDSPDDLCGFGTLYLDKGEKPLEVEQARVNKSMVLLKVKGVDSVESAVSLRGKVLYLDREDAPPNVAGEYYIQDLIGLTVLDADTGREWGRLSDVLFTGANDVYVVDGGDGKQRLVPKIPEVVLETDLDSGTMRIRPLKGLFDDAD